MNQSQPNPSKRIMVRHTAEHYNEFNEIWFKFRERASLKTLVLRTPCFGSSYP